MARYINGSSTYMTIGDNAALSFPDGGFTLAGWIYLIPSPTRGYYFYSHGTVQAVSSCNLAIASNGSLIAYVRSDAGVLKQVGWVVGAIAAGNWYHICLRCAGDDLRLYKNGVQSGNSDSASWGGINPSGSLYLGARNDLNATKFFDGHIAEWAKWDRAISDVELAALAAGANPLRFRQYLRWHWSGRDELREDVAGLVITNYGSTLSDHPPVELPPQNGIIQPVIQRALGV